MKKFFAVFAIILGSLGLYSASAGAQELHYQGAGYSGVCPVHDNGWFPGKYSTFQCVMTGNHIYIREWSFSGQDLGIVLEAWLPVNEVKTLINAGVWNSNHAAVYGCPTSALYSQGWNIVDYASYYHAGWEKTYRLRKSSPVPPNLYITGGVVNHWDTVNRAFSQEFTATCPQGTGFALTRTG